MSLVSSGISDPNATSYTNIQKIWLVPEHYLCPVSPARKGCPGLAAWVWHRCRYTASYNQKLGHLQFPHTDEEEEED